MQNFKYIGNVDISQLKQKLEENASDWDNQFTRQRAALFDTHRDVETLPLQWSAENLHQSPDMVAPKTEFYSKYYDATLFATLEEQITKVYGKGYFVRIILLKLLARQVIPKHTDNSESLHVNRRIHIPIKTNPNVLFHVGEETRNLQEGEICEIDNVGLHGVENNSDEDRIHLVVDWHVL